MDNSNKPQNTEKKLNDNELERVAGGRKLIWDDGYQQLWDDGTVTGSPNPFVNPGHDDVPPESDEWL